MEQTTPHPEGAIGPHGVLLHPGAPKAATTAIQSCLAALRDRLWNDGLVYPGTELNHIAASRGALGMPNVPHEAAKDARKWANLQRTVGRHPGRAIVSSELLAVCNDQRATQVVEALGGDRVHVVITLRSLGAVVPSAWQESVKAGSREPFGRFVDDVLERQGEAGTDPAGRFWTVHQQARMVRHWAGAVGPERVTVVPLDPARPDDVFAAFEQLIGLPTGMLDPALATHANRSLTWAEAEAVRSFNTLVDMPGEFQNVSEMLPPQVVSILVESRRPPADEERASLSPEAIERLLPLATEMTDEIRASGVRVLGDLDRLIPVVDHGVSTPTEPTSAPFDVVAHLLRSQREFVRRTRAAAAERKAAERQTRRARRGAVERPD
ncbi:MAG: hypothetical protein RJB65_317 [Actinomycetota bacterium]|jgi:hypothetical protein